MEAWFARYRAKAFVGAGEDTTRSFNTHLVHFPPRFMGGFLHRDSQKVGKQLKHRHHVDLAR